MPDAEVRELCEAFGVNPDELRPPRPAPPNAEIEALIEAFRRHEEKITATRVGGPPGDPRRKPLPSGEDYLIRPVHAGWIKYEDLDIPGKLDLADIVRMNEDLDVIEANERLAEVAEVGSELPLPAEAPASPIEQPPAPATKPQGQPASRKHAGGRPPRLRQAVTGWWFNDLTPRERALTNAELARSYLTAAKNKKNVVCGAESSLRQIIKRLREVTPLQETDEN